ncbi:MAG: hypothetical protein KJ630_02825 [Proteobacteria bacterium]|nr:hypothetical protein [Pseudomonadota bacterium]
MITDLNTPAIRSGGYCRRCGREHWLGPGNTLVHCRQLMELLTAYGTIDLFSGVSPGAPELTTHWLFGPARGKMLGVLECVRSDGTTIILRAFSGQYNGSWLVGGWAPPLFAVNEFLDLGKTVEPQIKALGRKIDACKNHDEQWLALRKERRLLSQQLMEDFHALYRLTNFRGETATLCEVFLGDTGIPTGTGDCCAPKLLNFAARQQLRPVGLTEFYWGQENHSGTRQHGSLSGSCAGKCRPILGFMLCGLEE